MPKFLEVNSSDWIPAHLRGWTSTHYIDNTDGGKDIEYSQAASPTTAQGSIASGGATAFSGSYLWIRGSGSVVIQSPTDWAAKNTKTYPVTAIPSSGRIVPTLGGVALPARVANGSLVIEDTKSSYAAATARAKSWLIRPQATALWTVKAFPGETLRTVENGVFKCRTVVGNYGTWYHDIPATLMPKRMVVYVDSPDWSKVDSIQINLTDSAGSTGWIWKWTRTGTVAWYGAGRRALSFSERDIKSLVGTPDVATTQIAKLSWTVVQNGASAQAETWFSGIERDVLRANRRATISIGADDCLAGWFSTGIPILQSAGIYNSYNAVICDKIGTVGFANSAQMRSFVDSGGECIVHGPLGLYEGGDLRKYTDYAGVYGDITAGRDYLLNNDYARNGSETIYVFPRGIYDFATGDDTIYRALRDAGFKAARVTTEASGAQLVSSPAIWTLMRERLDCHNAYGIPIIGHSWSSSDEAANIARIIAAIDTLVADGTDGVLMFHDVVTTPNTATQISAANLTTIANRLAYHASAGNLDILSPTQQWLPFVQDLQL